MNEGEIGERQRCVGGSRLTGSSTSLFPSMFSSVRFTHSHMVAGISVTLLYLQHRGAHPII